MVTAVLDMNQHGESQWMNDIYWKTLCVTAVTIEAFTFI